MNRKKAMICMMVVMLLGLGYSVPVNGQEAVTEQAKSETTENLSTEQTTENTVTEENSSAEKTTEKKKKEKNTASKSKEEKEASTEKEKENDTREEINHQPRILVEDNSLQTQRLEAGKDTAWNLTVKNYGSKAVENMKVTLLSESSDIRFEKTSWYEGHLGTGGTMDLSQTVSVSKKAATEPISVQFQFEYEDDKGNSYTSTEMVILSVNQPQKAEIVNLSFPDIVYSSDTNALTFQILNIGLADLYNARVSVEGKGLFPVQDVFLGNISAGESKEGEMQIFIGTLDMDEEGKQSEEKSGKYGAVSGIVTFSFEDENGEIKEQKLDIHTEIKEAQIVQLKIEKEKEETNQWWITVIVILILTLVLVIAALYLRLQYFKKRVDFHEEAEHL